MSIEQTILIVDDEKDLLSGLKRLIAPELNCEVLTASSAQEAIKFIEHGYVDIVLSDFRMPQMDGMELLSIIKKIAPQTSVVLMTAYGCIELAVEALKLGAYDFLTKPLDEERLLHVLSNCLERQQLIKKTDELKKKIQEKTSLNQFIGTSPGLQKTLSLIKLVANTELSVLITGESGTGKELAAKTIHTLSDRRDREMVAINCPAIPEHILESELFGYKKGAFTHATQDKKGLFEEASGSSLLLDEIGDLSPALQIKLLRVLQEKEIRPLGGTKNLKINVRIIASTNQNLIQKMQTGAFREDLFYRLNEISIEMPPLREIKEDIPMMSQAIVEDYCKKTNQAPKKIAIEALHKLEQAEWKGNFRELQNVMKKAVVLSQGNIILPEHIEIMVTSPCFEQNMDRFITMPFQQARAEVLEKFTVTYVKQLLAKTDGNISAAAIKSGIKRQSLQYLIRKYQIPAKDDAM